MGANCQAFFNSITYHSLNVVISLFKYLENISITYNWFKLFGPVAEEMLSKYVVTNLTPASTYSANGWGIITLMRLSAFLRMRREMLRDEAILISGWTISFSESCTISRMFCCRDGGRGPVAALRIFKALRIANKMAAENCSLCRKFPEHLNKRRNNK